MGSRNRRTNYRTFRAQLEVPLLTVEWAVDGRFELGESDADVLIQVSSPDILWQKERLLCIGLRALPDSADFVAWLDCDVVFEKPGWSTAACEELESSVVAQLFRHCTYRGPDGRAEDAAVPSLVHLSREPASEAARFDRLWARPKAAGARRDRLSGHAWAARRELLERHGFYDACVFGAGDRALACAAFGQHRRAEQSWLRTDHQQKHYFRWADAFAADVDGRIGLVDAELVHLWHGSLEGRQHRVRHAVAERHDFDPAQDIEIRSPAEPWRWASPKPGLHRSVARFFADRNEDARI
jgi:hypothetical protein